MNRSTRPPGTATPPLPEIFRLLRRTQPEAATLVVETAHEAIWLHAVRGRAGELLWFDEDNYGNHPDAHALGGSPELDYDRDVIGQVEALLLTLDEDAFVSADDLDYQGLSRPDGRNLLTVTAG